jgi:galactose mutarotase-like enzyme
MTEQCLALVDKENVLIGVGDCSVTVLPHLGGKIASIRVKGRELLQAPLAPLAPRTRSMPFDASDASGWDECLPSVAECTVETTDGERKIPDHGDLWRVDWKPVACSDHSVALRAKCFSLPLTLERTLVVTESARGWHLSLSYKLINHGAHPVPWSWAAHPLFSAEKGDRIVLPQSIHSLQLEGSGGGRLGTSGATVSWPIAALSNKNQTNLSVAQSPNSGIGDKLFAGPLTEGQNWAALERPSAGLRIKFGFDVAATPYLGLWICYGGWPSRPGPKQVCVALEPSTAPADSLAKSGPWSRVLAAGHSFEWPMHVDLEPI